MHQDIPATKYTILSASSLQNFMQNIESHVLPPLLNPHTNPLPPFFFLGGGAFSKICCGWK